VLSDAIFARLHPIPKLSSVKRPDTDDGSPV
jgi:hypothetical protein